MNTTNSITKFIISVNHIGEEDAYILNFLANTALANIKHHNYPVDHDSLRNIFSNITSKTQFIELMENHLADYVQIDTTTVFPQL